MSNLYYLLSGLPTLSLDKEVSLSYESFISGLGSFVSSEQLDRVIKFTLSSAPKFLDSLPDLEKSFWDWEISLRNDLVRLRAELLVGVRADDYINPMASVGIASDVAKEAFKQENPLEAETMIDQGRWQLLESLKAGRVFDFDMLLIYSMQLQVVLRRTSFSLEKGKENYHREYKRIMQDAETILMENI